MPYVPVNVYVVDSTPAAAPIIGAVVRIFTADGITPITEALTDSNGLAALLLNSGTTYQARYYKYQVAFPKPQLLAISDSELNDFQVMASALVPPLSPDPRLCVAFGFFRTVTGGPAANVDIQFISQFDPLILEGAGILNERQIAKTDVRGYVEVPLIRCGKYSLIIAGMEDIRRDIAVPDQANVNLPDLIFPVVREIVFSVPAPFNLAVGERLQTTPTLIASDGNSDRNYWDVRWSTTDPSIAVVQPAGGVLTLIGVAAGTTQLVAVRKDKSIIAIPDLGIIGVPAQITVS